MADTIESKGGMSYQVVLEDAKSPVVPKVVSRLNHESTTPVLTKAEIDEKLTEAESRRKQTEMEKLEKLAKLDKHAEEVRANKEKHTTNGHSEEEKKE